MTIDGSNLLQLVTIFKNIVTFLLGIAGGVAVIIIIIGGIRYILAGGDPKATLAARNSITFGIIGLIIIILAVSIVTIIGQLLGSGTLSIFTLGGQ